MVGLEARRRTPRFWWGWSVALVLTGALLLLASLPPFVNPGTRALVMNGFSTVCHQLPARSPTLDGVTLAVCHRCYGIYWGLLVAVVGFLVLVRWDAYFNRNAALVLLLALLPAGLDWMLGLLGVWENTPVSRLLTGGLAGVAAGYYLARALAKAFIRETASQERSAGG